MTLFFDREPRETPKPDGSDPKEVWAFFGLAVYHAQVLEQGLVNLAVGLQARGLTRLTHRDFDTLFTEMGRKTLGQLITDIRQQTDVSSALAQQLRAALRDRNHIAHKFFVVHDIDIMSERGRNDMINELRQIIERLQEVDQQVETVTHNLWVRLGMTRQMVQDELAKMNAEAERKDLVGQ